MMKSWADHCSSDEDTDDNYSVESAESEDKNLEEVPQSLDEAFEEKAQIESTPPERTYDYPTRPPFTAFVGNLSFHIQEASQLQQALADVVFERLGERVNVLGGRISFDRNSQKHRGFGYVELETLEELKTVMKLNDDDQAMLAGRKIQVDTANHSPHRQNNNNNNNNFNRGGRGRNNDRGSFERKPHEKIDGSKFRGGKFNNQNFNRNNNNNNKNNNNSNNESKPADAGPPRQRPSLKLAPRSKPIEDRSSGSSDIFGGAKARDEQAWERGRQQQGGEKKILKKPDAEKKGDNAKPNDKGGRGGRGGRGGKDRGGKGGRGGDHKKKRNSQTEKKKPPAEEKAPPAPKSAAKPAEEPPKPKEKGPKNKFALLMDDSDSD